MVTDGNMIIQFEMLLGIQPTRQISLMRENENVGEDQEALKDNKALKHQRHDMFVNFLSQRASICFHFIMNVFTNELH